MTSDAVVLGRELLGAAERLAAKLGVTIEQVYPYFVRQVWLEAATNLAVVGSLAIGSLAISAWLFRRTSAWSIEHPNASWRDTPNSVDVENTLKWVLLVVALVMIAVAVAVNMPDLLNPQYTAIRRMASAVCK